MVKKKCTKCNIVKSLSSFGKKERGKFGRTSICTGCNRIRSKKYYRDNRESELKRASKNRESLDWKLYSKEYRARNKKRLSRLREIWVKNNPEKIRKYRLTKYQKRDRLRDSTSAMMNHSLKRVGSSKSGSKLFEIVDYTLDDLKSHLESQFTEDMDWENYGSFWHVDHIRPIASFTYSSTVDEDFKICWSLDNLQPLPAIENYRKGSFYKGKYW